MSQKLECGKVEVNKAGQKIQYFLHQGNMCIQQINYRNGQVTFSGCPTTERLETDTVVAISFGMPAREPIALFRITRLKEDTEIIKQILK